jgi:hypothetical protein
MHTHQTNVFDREHRTSITLQTPRLFLLLSPHQYGNYPALLFRILSKSGFAQNPVSSDQKSGSYAVF